LLFNAEFLAERPVELDIVTMSGWRRADFFDETGLPGPVEASFAGALGVRLGGTLAYGGRVEHRPVLNGVAGRAVETPDIERAVRLSRRVSALALGVCVAGRLIAGRRRI
ncbi:cobalamin biosynthesis protein, partial [Streptomyces sp. 24-1644]|uniref:cobalamin biosynthesis protein n=1 Tax=Streptomyces sp. 24-1644 TaxID=3457315 RepID=UPI003FA69E6D